ncbi:hypothetical protein [Iodobacter fluviatilis]|uniref:Uncharacterized protein n=1 Tax=Iodobacter fluviatilis TaxID=537 RepID=A0A377SUJ4_9NEIS|nr:hypothetical protein [Iodobacter fluviatilis]TCU85507.1 hypothetical protein EV682_10717 [Iodobacter fluviatilis]STR45045.1 Uncharacterised protein [Iodobacter fluviatilis]
MNLEKALEEIGESKTKSIFFLLEIAKIAAKLLPAGSQIIANEAILFASNAFVRGSFGSKELYDFANQTNIRSLAFEEEYLQSSSEKAAIAIVVMAYYFLIWITSESEGQSVPEDVELIQDFGFIGVVKYARSNGVVDNKSLMSLIISMQE